MELGYEAQKLLLSALIFVIFSFVNVGPQLIINVKNQGGDIIQESIVANVSEDTVSLEFLRSDGTLIMHIIDFANEVQLLKVVMPGEEEWGQTQYQVLCFLTHSANSEFIAADAMAKLRQKNPGSVRVAEEERPTQRVHLDTWLSTRARLSPLLAQHCAEAPGTVYTSRAHLHKWSSRPGMDSAWLLSLGTPFPSSSDDNSVETLKSCAVERDTRSPCTCHFEACIGWYPCGLKYCKGKPQANMSAQNLSYRCGIKTCRKCQRFEYYVHKKMHCLWDE